MDTPSFHEQCWEPTTSLDDIRKCIRDGHYVMVIIRGIPGSGKSYLASDLVSGTNGAVFNTDKYFMQNGVYQFDLAKLDEFHLKNWKEAKNAVLQGVKPVIIDNTNIYVAHMKPYINLAVKNMYELYFVEPETEWKKNVKECARRNAHSVPKEKIAYMAECFEKINLADVIKPTQLRIAPPLMRMSDSDETYNLLLSKLDSSAAPSTCCLSPSKYSQFVQKTHAKKQEVEKSEPSRPSHSQCTLYDEMKISPSISLSETNVTEKKESSEQLFSLIPNQACRRSLRSVGCQTSDLIRTFGMSDPLPFVSDEFISETMLEDVDKKKMKVKAIQAGDGNIPPDIELLLAFFPNEKPSDLLHLLETVGLNNTITLLKEMNAHMESCGSVSKSRNIDTEPLSGTYYWWEEAEFEEIDKSSSSLVPYFEMNRAIPENLAPCTYLQCCDPEPVREGYYRMAISIDMMEQLTKLFGNSESNNILKTYVDLPIWLWRQIYFFWQGSSKDNAFERDNFEFSSLVSCDEELARILQNQELAADDYLENGRHMSIAERLQLSALINDYSGVDRERIIECFCDNKFCAAATRNTLEFFINGSENIQKTPTDPPPLAFPVNRSNSSTCATFSRHVTSDGLSVSKPDLESAHKDACELRLEADRYNRQKHEMLSRAMNHQEYGAKMYYFAEAKKLGKKAKDCVAQLNEQLTQANISSLFIDLHYMDVPSAIKLLKAKLSAADRPLELRRGRSGKKFVVLTGYGKLNDGQAKIRPAVLQWLEQCGYEYYSSSNKGELIVECK